MSNFNFGFIISFVGLILIVYGLKTDIIKETYLVTFEVDGGFKSVEVDGEKLDWIKGLDGEGVLRFEGGDFRYGISNVKILSVKSNRNGFNPYLCCLLGLVLFVVGGQIALKLRFD